MTSAAYIYRYLRRPGARFPIPVTACFSTLPRWRGRPLCAGNPLIYSPIKQQHIMKTKLFALIVLILLPLGMAAQSHSVEARSKAKPGVTLETILGKSLLTESDKALLDEGYSSQSTQMKIMDLTQQSDIYDGEDDARAFRFMHEAARLGDCWALCQVGLKYYLGDGTTMDRSKGKKCLQKAASMDGYGSKLAKDLLRSIK